MDQCLMRRDAAEKVNKNLKARAPHIRDSMKGLNQRNGLPVYENEVSFSAPPRPERDVVIPFPRHPGLLTTYLARAA